MSSHAFGSGAEVVIVGGGLEGAAVAWELSRRGVTDVLVLERSTVGAGMTGKSSGIVRGHYGVRSLAAMAAYGLEILEHGPEIFGDDLGFRQTGYVVGVGEENAANFRRSLSAQRAVGVTTEEIDRQEVAKLWPLADLTPFGAFAWEPRGGYGDAYRTAQAFARSARAAGARIRQHAEVTKLELEGERVSGVWLADGERVAADVVVVATGVWTRPLLQPLGLTAPITPHREQIVLIDPGEPLGEVPVFSDLVSLHYVRSEGGQLLFGNSDLHALEVVDPDGYRNRADDRFVELVIDKFSTRFPSLANAAITSSYAGCYDVTPDWNPIISRTPVPGLLVVAGFSGHGFKIAPAVGRLAADLIIGGQSGDPAVPHTDFEWSRFDEGRLLRTPYPYVGAGEMR